MDNAIEIAGLFRQAKIDGCDEEAVCQLLRSPDLMHSLLRQLLELILALQTQHKECLMAHSAAYRQAAQAEASMRTLEKAIRSANERATGGDASLWQTELSALLALVGPCRDKAVVRRLA